MSLEKPEKIIQFPKIKRMDEKFDPEAIEKLVKKNFLSNEELEVGEDQRARELSRKIKRARPDFEIVEGQK